MGKRRQALHEVVKNLPSVMSLKECPFCGSADVAVLEILVRAWSGKCLKCETLGPEEVSEEFAALAWNKGTPRHHEVHELKAALERVRAKQDAALRVARTLVRTGRPLRNFGQWVDAKRELQELEKDIET